MVQPGSSVYKPSRRKLPELSQREPAVLLLRPDSLPDADFVERRQVTLHKEGGQQGQALHKLGHAVTYLVDSRLFLTDGSNPKAERQALHILMRASREVFLECPQAVSIWDRTGTFCRESFARQKQR